MNRSPSSNPVNLAKDQQLQEGFSDKDFVLKPGEPDVELTIGNIFLL